MRAAGAHIASAAALFIASTATAQSQYRDGTPDVMPTPRAAPDTAGAELARSRQAYETAGAPRVVVFWNRQLSDRITNDYDDVVLERGESATGAAAGVSRNGRYKAGARASNYESEVRTGRREVTDDQRASLFDEDEEWRFLDAFDRQLQRSGIRLVDRGLAMRALAASDGSPSDKQTVEMQGIAARADLLMTILQTPASDTPLGVLFKISVIDLRTGEVRTSMVSEGTGPVRGPGRFVAGENGFQRKQPSGVDIVSAGSNVAADVMREMSASW